MTPVRNEISLFLAGVMFLTRLPVPAEDDPPGDQLARAAKYFPLVGVLVGLISGVAWLLALQIMAPILAAGVACAAGILVTGALHEDGLADTCDGLGGGSTAERALEIMRDSRIGTYGAIGLILSVGLRWFALADMGAWTGFTALVVAHIAGRLLIVVALSVADYARDEGAGVGVAGGVHGSETAVAIGISLLLAGLLAGWSGMFVLAAATLCGGAMIALLVRKLGGYTGDGLGAVEQVAETSALIVLAGALADG